MKTSIKVILISTILLVTGGVIYYFTKKKTVTASSNLPVDSFTNTGGSGAGAAVAGILPGGSFDTPAVVPVATGVVNEKVQVYTPSAPVPVKQDSVRDSYMRSLTGYFSDQKYLDAFNKMSNEELAASWYYVGTYLSPGVQLLSATRKLTNGEWDNSNPGNPGLFSKISAIRSKYGIF